MCWISNVTLLWLEGSQSLALLLCGLLIVWFAILRIYGKHRKCDADLIRRVEDQTVTHRVEAITNLPKLLPCHFKHNSGFHGPDLFYAELKLVVFVILQGAGGAADILTAAIKYTADESSNDEVTAEQIPQISEDIRKKVLQNTKTKWPTEKVNLLN